MTKETLFAVLNDLDDAHITQAEAVPPKKRGWRVWAGLAACLAIVVGALFWRGRPPPFCRGARWGGGSTCLIDRLIRLAWSIPMIFTLTSCPS